VESLTMGQTLIPFPPAKSLKNEQILFYVYWCWVVWSWFLQIFLRFW
jgi:hypothetical protein